MTKLFVMIGASLAGLSVAAGAFGAHALKDKVDARGLEIWQTASEYQMSHALALLFVGWLSTRVESTAVMVAGVAFVVGTLVFSGSLYALALSGVRWLGAITPIGGVAFLVGWVAVLVAATKL